VPEPAQSVNVDDIPALPSDAGDWKPIRLHFDITAFGVNAWAAREAGQLVIERHTETEDSDTRHQELYFVARGHATFIVDGREIDAPVGTLVYVPDPESVREATARDAETLVLIVGGAPGEAFTPSEWETKHA
jgi:mannose-6-phosphate isomerase-like protein (cupin superfamily)